MKAQTGTRGRNAQKVDWSDMPFVLSVCEAGSLAGAARMMDVNHSTVYRRIEGVEERLGVRLFERHSHGYVMTPAGELFYSRAILLCNGINQIELELGGKDLRLEGQLTVTTTDSLLHCLTPIFSAFQEAHPDVDLRLLSNARSLDLSRRDADIALRPTLNPPEHWIGRKLSKILCAPYVSVPYWESAKDLPPEELRWIILDDDLDQSPMSKVTMLKKHKDARITIVSTVMGVLDAVKSGLGVAVLPSYLGEHSDELLRLDDPEENVVWDLWLLAHPDVRRSARVHAFFDYATANVTDELFRVTPV
ncbi:MAG: LysR family transcriptional regulator [Pseudomonadota bacterium]